MTNTTFYLRSSVFLQYLLGEELGKGVASSDGSSLFLGGNLLGGSLFLGNDLLFGLGFFNVPGEKKKRVAVSREAKQGVRAKHSNPFLFHKTYMVSVSNTQEAFPPRE